MLAKEKLAFRKMASICELEERHGVNLGQGYKNDQACSAFIDFIASDQQQSLTRIMSQSKLQADASTDAGNIEVELYL